MRTCRFRFVRVQQQDLNKTSMPSCILLNPASPLLCRPLSTPTRPPCHRSSISVLPATASRRCKTYASSSPPTSTTTVNISTLKQQLKQLAGTKNGTDRDEQQRKELAAIIEQLNTANPTPAPATAELGGTEWVILYTDSSGNSSGKLGPFVGVTGVCVLVQRWGRCTKCSVVRSHPAPRTHNRPTLPSRHTWSVCQLCILFWWRLGCRAAGGVCSTKRHPHQPVVQEHIVFVAGRAHHHATQGVCQWWSQGTLGDALRG